MKDDLNVFQSFNTKAMFTVTCTFLIFQNAEMT